jgi:hypothetical protein
MEVEVMFGRGKPSPTEKEQLLNELAQSYGHLKLAAGHVAGGTAEKVTPSYDKARNAASRGWSTTKGAFAPLYEQIQQGATNARREYIVAEKRKSRWPMLMGLLAAGAAVGAAGAMVAKRRRAATWEEFEPMPEDDEFGYGTADSTPSSHKVSQGAASVADKLSAQAGKVADSMQSKASRNSSSTSDTGAFAVDTEPPE